MANLADLAVGVSADTSGIESAMDDAASSVEDFESTTSKAGSFVEDNFLKIGAAAAGIGTGLEGFARSQQDANVGFERMGRVTGEGADKMRDMATSLQNVTFPMEDVTALMETATQRGLEGDAIAEYATFWDKVGDATGEAGPALAEAGVALGLVGISAGEEAEALDAFGYITDQTTGSVEEFLGFIEKTATELGDATPTVDEMAGALGALEDQGLSSQRAQRELRTALSETDGDMVAALETLGVSEKAYQEQIKAVEGSSGAIDANAQALADSFTPMQKMSSRLENVMTKYGGLADAAGAVAAPMAGVGSAMMGVSMVAPNLVTKIGTLVGAIGTKIAAMTSWAATTVAQGTKALGSMAITAGQFIAHYTRMAVASLAQAARMAASWVIAMGPVGWVIAAVVGLVALIVANWDTVKEWTKKIWDWVGDKIEAVWTWITDTTTKAVDAVVGFVGDLRDKATDIIQAIVDFVEKYHPIMILWRLAKEWVPKAISWFVDLKDKALAKVTDLRDRVVDTVKNLWDKVVGFFGDLKDDAVSIVKGMVKTYVEFVVNLRDDVVGFVADLKDKVVSFFGGLKDSAVEKVTVLKDKVSGFFGDVRDTAVRIASDLKDKVTSFFSGLKDSAVEQVEALMDRVKGIKDDVLGFFSGAATWLRDAGRNIIQGIINGIGDKIAAVGNKMNQVASTVRDKLPFSPAKEGPLSGRGSPDIAGGKLVEMVADGMGGQLGTLSRMADAAAAAAMPGLSTPGLPRVAALGGDGVSAGGGTDAKMMRRELRLMREAVQRQSSQTLVTAMNRSERLHG